MRTGQQFRRGLVPMLGALIEYSRVLEREIASFNSIEAAESVNTTPIGRKDELAKEKIKIIMQTYCHDYPEWVFKRGFNRFLRGGFRYILIHIDQVIDAFFSLDYYLSQPVDTYFMTSVAPQLQRVISKNTELLQIIHDFFAGANHALPPENITSDITDIQGSLKGVLPDSIELLEISPDYVILAALARDVVDLRELLLKILASLPIDAVTVQP